MKEIKGDLWAYLNKENHIICILTNSTLKGNGRAVMGAGCALQAARRFPNLPAELGAVLRKEPANTPGFHILSTWDKGRRLQISVGIFPTKRNWWDNSRLGIINMAAKELGRIARMFPKTTYILPRPGVGWGKLRWEDVKPLLEGKLPDNVLVISPKKKDRKRVANARDGMAGEDD